MQAFVAARAQQDLAEQRAQAQAHQHAQAELLHQGDEHFPAEADLRVHHHPHQHQGDEDRHRVVEAGFDLQGAGHPLVDGHAGALDHIEDRGGVGGADDAAQQQAQAPVHVHQPGGEGAHQRGGQHHAHGGQAERRLQRQAEGGQPGAQAAVEQNNRQGDVADHIGQREIIELNAADTVFAGHHAHHQEHQQGGHADARTQGAQQQPHEHQAGADQQENVQ